jgi:hypothetical protein
MFFNFTLALSAVCVQCPIQLFICSSLILCSPGLLLGYCLSDFEMVILLLLLIGILKEAVVAYLKLLS